eukprot:gnl/TRDRNA2_/TRDRNA2_88846_c0_seq1.p2 gnl/TRDRNA2_/TRDRNA2_88846_c0~~gnl/TRDRNA2_/TRDRNA2_88846_c0_seq1.p2  ORF type:complete len:229 (-),score=6.01 gnl/TRDRNA2_/TRDRNA2_88846_c0_seq1:133-819(-)
MQHINESWNAHRPSYCEATVTDQMQCSATSSTRLSVKYSSVMDIAAPKTIKETMVAYHIQFSRPSRNMPTKPGTRDTNMNCNKPPFRASSNPRSGTRMATNPLEDTSTNVANCDGFNGLAGMLIEGARLDLSCKSGASIVCVEGVSYGDGLLNFKWFKRPVGGEGIWNSRFLLSARSSECLIGASTAPKVIGYMLRTVMANPSCAIIPENVCGRFWSMFEEILGPYVR